MYQTIQSLLREFGVFREEAVKPDVIFFKTKSTFLALKIKKRWIDVEFFLDHLDDIPPVKKFLQTSKNRFAHLVSIDEMEDIDQQLIDWIRASYGLISNA